MGRIQNFVSSILGPGLSYNNEYSFWFQAGPEKANSVYSDLYDLYQGAFSEDTLITGSKMESAGFKIQILCEEISLPGVSSATGNGRGIYQGVDFKYAHTKIYNDLSVSFICDKDYTPMRFFQTWFHYVYDGSDSNSYSYTKSYTTRPYYEYCMDMTIVKDEDKGLKVDPDTKKHASAEYALKNVFPISISSIPLNTGASQVVRFTVNLTYERWVVKFNRPEKIKEGNDLFPLGKSLPDRTTP